MNTRYTITGKRYVFDFDTMKEVKYEAEALAATKAGAKKARIELERRGFTVTVTEDK